MVASTLVDLVKISITSTGAGALALGPAVSSFRGTEALQDGASYSYSIQQNGNYETGQGVYTAINGTFTRDVAHSNAGNAPLPLAEGAELVITALAVDINPASPGGGGAPVAGSQFILEFGFVAAPGASAVIANILINQGVTLPANLSSDIGRIVGIAPGVAYTMTLKYFAPGDNVGTNVGTITINTDRSITRATTSGLPVTLLAGSVLQVIGAVTPGLGTNYAETLIGVYL